MGKLHMPLKIIIVWVLAVFFLGDSILRSLRSNFNFGLLLVYLITGGLCGSTACFTGPSTPFVRRGRAVC